MIDLGIPVKQLQFILEDYREYIDFAKLGVGTAYITPNIYEKIELYKAYNVKPYFGGTFFEKCYVQQKLPEYLSTLQKYSVEWIEVSCGTVDIPLEERMDLIHQLRKDFNCLAEVGCKDANKDMEIVEWKREIRSLLEAGAKYCITEGRESGTAGIYDKNGRVKSDIIQELVKEVDVNKIIFEAPTYNQQNFFIKQFGPNVNLGNVKITDCLIVEAERLGLRSDTFYLS